jgi:hypothetical protein
MNKFFEHIFTGSYLLASLALFGMAVTIMGWSVYEVAAHFDKKDLVRGEFISIMLQSVGAIVIAVAIIDVAKYMIEEEVYRSKELRSLREAREIITKIIVILSIAIGIEGLVYIFKAGIEDITLLIYPAILVAISVALIIGLGVFHKLSSEAETAE